MSAVLLNSLLGWSGMKSPSTTGANSRRFITGPEPWWSPCGNDRSLLSTAVPKYRLQVPIPLVNQVRPIEVQHPFNQRDLVKIADAYNSIQYNKNNIRQRKKTYFTDFIWQRIRKTHKADGPIDLNQFQPQFWPLTFVPCHSELCKLSRFVLKLVPWWQACTPWLSSHKLSSPWDRQNNTTTFSGQLKTESLRSFKKVLKRC